LASARGDRTPTRAEVLNIEDEPIIAMDISCIPSFADLAPYVTASPSPRHARRERLAPLFYLAFCVFVNFLGARRPQGTTSRRHGYVLATSSCDDSVWHDDA
jgi:hypothetical protein